MTPYVIADIRRNRSDLGPPSDYINFLCSDRIKTLNIKYKADIEPLKMENVLVKSFPVDDEAFKYEYIPESDHDEADNYSNVNMKSEEDNELSESLGNIDSGFKNTTDSGIPTVTLNPDHTKSDPDTVKSSFVDPAPKIEENSPKLKNKVLTQFLLNLDNDDSSNDFSFGMDIDIGKVIDENRDLDKKKTNKTNKRVAKTKGDKEVVKVNDPVETHKFMGIIREPKGELSKGNWETKLLTEDEAIEQFKKKEFDSKYERMEFKCTKCFKGFSKNDMLLRHNKLWHDKVRYKDKVKKLY